MKQAEIERLLPGIFQRTLRPDSLLSGLLAVMEDLHAPSEAALAHLETIFDPRRTPDRFVPFLASWVDLDRLFEQGADRTAQEPISSGTGRLRELIAIAGYLSRWRGTARGLLMFLETATGHFGFDVLEQVPGPDGLPIPFHILVRAPEASRPNQALIERIIQSEKPAYVTYTLVFVSDTDSDR